MTVLITGSNGFLGARLAHRLAKADIRVKAMVRRKQPAGTFNHANIEEVLGDISDPESLKRCFEGVQQVYHLAALANDWAPDNRAFYQVNVQGTINVLEAAKAAGVTRVVVTSTAGTVGPPDPDNVYPVDEDHVRLVHFFTQYAVSKAIAEEFCQHYVRRGMDIVIVNPTRVYGPGKLDRKNGYVLVMDRYLHKAFAMAPGVRDVVGNYVHVDDVVEGHVLAMEKGKTGEKYLLGGSDVTFTDLFNTLHKVSGRKGRVFRIPFGLIYLIARFQGLLARWFKRPPMVTVEWFTKASYNWPVSSAKATRDFGYAPMEFEEAVEKTVQWLREKKGENGG